MLIAAFLVPSPAVGAIWQWPADACMHAPGGSQDRGFIPTSYFRHLDASVAVLEGSNRMDVSIRISLVAARETNHVFATLNPAMAVASVRDESFGALSYKNLYGSVLNISLGRTVPAGTGLNLSLAYGGNVLNTPDDGVSYWDYVGTEGSWVRTYGWYFPYDEQRDRTTSRITITVPAGKVAVAPGVLSGTVPDAANGTVSYTWENADPVSGLSFVAAALNHTTVRIGPTPYEVYFRTDHSGLTGAYAAELDRTAGFYKTFLGPAGYRNLTVVEVPDKFAAWGQTVPSMIWLASRNFAGPFPYRILAHELGHQWWGVDVQGKEFQDNWVQEGFAGYCEALYEMAVYGSRGFLDYCRTQYINQFVQSSYPEPTLSGNNYELAASKGPWVLHMLRYIIGDERFNRTLFDFHHNFSGMQVSPSDFSGLAVSESGPGLEGFFDFWLNGSGRLDIALSDAVVFRGSGALDRLQLTLERRGGPAGFGADLGFYNEEGHQIALVPNAWNASAYCATVHYDIGYPVDTVKLDPDGWLLDAHPSNNELPTRGASLDFWVSDILPSQERPWDNESFTVNVSLASASSEGPNNVTAELSVDGLQVANGSAQLPPAGMAWVDFDRTLPAGTHRLDIILDPAGEFFETDRTNNAASLNITVVTRPPVLPDLRISPGGIGFSPETAVGGDFALLFALVENVGGAAARNITVRFWVDSKDTGFVGSRGELDLLPGQSAVASVDWTALPGRHEVMARAETAGGVDSDTANNEASGMLYVNARPTAILSCSDHEPLAGEWVEFSGATSGDDGRVTHYLFDTGDGELDGWLPDAGTSHVYLSKGVYEARLKVVDDQGAESDWSPSVTVRVVDGAPVAVILAGPATGNVRTVFVFRSLSQNGDGPFACATWSFGDGRYAQGEMVNHSFASHGDFTVTLTVEDDAGRSARAMTMVRVLDLPPMPAISLPKQAAWLGEKVEFDASGSSDPDDLPSSLSFAWDFGDGQRAVGKNASYAFRSPGVYRVVLTASDGNQSAETAVTVSVRYPPAAQTPKPGAGWLSWAVLGALLCAMGLLVASMMIPDGDRVGREEEE